MRIRIDHSTTYAYDRAARFIIQTLRLTPRSSEAQTVRDWRIETNVDARLRRSEDAFGNIVHALYTEQPTQSLTVRVSGEVVTTDTAGVVPQDQETLSPLVFLRDTPLTQRDQLISVFASEFSAHPALERMHRLMAAIHGSVAFEVGVTTPTHTAAEVLALGRGVCQDHAHVFIACARQMGVPARYVSGHLLRSDRDDQDAAHAWAEAWIDDLGWVGFDPANGVCPTERYVRVATGLDYLGAAPVRGASYGGGGERLAVRLSVRDADMQQSQQQA
ncbi:transglutaminase family protein [Brevundimonas lenta]|uniref:Transglutaminase-like putative cysteine protease n=1 Tax=Brevundimonas lenta TaxID=424796 RepID=A0A7W6NQZ9_9CAUL|nr:transglutaminase family protein [Brevundimonas lenta]MBB4083645.1 transglutaminase-like putative cysteine protease [Brevundimonas lenta]